MFENKDYEIITVAIKKKKKFYHIIMKNLKVIIKQTNITYI